MTIDTKWMSKELAQAKIKSNNKMISTLEKSDEKKFNKSDIKRLQTENAELEKVEITQNELRKTVEDKGSKRKIDHIHEHEHWEWKNEKLEKVRKELRKSK